MRLINFVITISAVGLLLSFTSSCKKNAQQDDNAQKIVDSSNLETYFSLKQYYNDHISNVGGQPYTIVQMTSADGKLWDSLMTDAFAINWNDIRDVFFKTDIGYPQYLNQYDFQIIKDTSTNRIQYIYTALNDDLKTKQLIIMVDDEHFRVKGIFIDWREQNLSKDVYQKFYYKPLEEIQINTSEVSLTGKTSELYQKWIFLTGDNHNDE